MEFGDLVLQRELPNAVDKYLYRFNWRIKSNNDHSLLFVKFNMIALRASLKDTISFDNLGENKIEENTSKNTVEDRHKRMKEVQNSCRVI